MASPPSPQETFALSAVPHLFASLLQHSPLSMMHWVAVAQFIHEKDLFANEELGVSLLAINVEHRKASKGRYKKDHLTYLRVGKGSTDHVGNTHGDDMCFYAFPEAKDIKRGIFGFHQPFKRGLSGVQQYQSMIDKELQPYLEHAWLICEQYQVLNQQTPIIKSPSSSPRL